MPTLETPPNPATPPTLPELPESIQVAAGRYSNLDHSEIVHLLSTLDDEVARARLRESIYISLFICLALAWFAIYGPRVLFHQGRLVNVATEHKKELSYLEVPPDLKKIIPPPKHPAMQADQNHQAQTRNPVPVPEPPKPMMGHPNPPAAAPQPPAPQPQQRPQPQPQQPQPQPQQQPRPQPPQVASSIPDAPRPTQQPAQQRPTFSTPTDPGASISQAARDAARQSGQGGEGGTSKSVSRRTGAAAQVEILSDTLGTDFGPYIRRLVRTTENAWYPLIPEECREPLFKTGQTLIRFTIDKNGAITAMHLEDSTHDVAIDKSSWGSLVSQGQLPPLPSTFKGQNLELRFHFIIAREGTQAE